MTASAIVCLQPRKRARPAAPAAAQRGAISVLFGLTLVVLLAAGGLVLDLGHVYVMKSELQNGADSAALAGANELDQSAPGVARAVARAQAFAQQNKVNFSSTLVITEANISFGPAPDGPFVSVAQAQASPADKRFIRVDTGTRTVPTYLMGVAGIATVATSGQAVAGPFVVDITPLGVCAPDAVNRIDVRPLVPPVAGTLEMVEYGFRRGTTYDLLALKNIAGSSDLTLINPVDGGATCEQTHSSTAFTSSFICQGNSAIPANATHVYGNTGLAAGPVEKALNSRFNDFSASSCQASSAPPDRNIREYLVGDAAHGPGRWMAPPAQVAQSQPVDATGTPSPSLVDPARQGVLWTYSRPLRASGLPGSYGAGSAFDISDWASLYAGLTAIGSAYPVGASASPYAQTSGPYFLAPATNTPTPERRVLNLAILDCTIPAAAGACRRIPMLGVGRFFLQRRAALTGSDKGVWVEFAGLAPTLNAKVKLYR